MFKYLRGKRGTAELGLFLILILLFTGSLPVMSAELGLQAESAVLLEAHGGTVLYEKDAHKVMYPASMTKLMTLIIAVEALEEGKVKLTDMVTASDNAASYGGSQIYLAPGEQLSFKELLLAVALASGNDASVAIAEYVAGTHEDFVELMNNKAAELGLQNTHFVNCNGLHDANHYTTAADFAQVALEALRHPQILELSSVKHYRIREATDRPFQFDNKNKLLWFYPGADGFKTGWTSDAKYCFTGTAVRDGLRFVSVVMGVSAQGGHFADTKLLYNWGYSQFVFKEFYPAGQMLGEVGVAKGECDSVKVLPAAQVGLTVQKGKDKGISAEVELPQVIDAPVNKGQVVGYVSLVSEGKVLGRVNVLAGEDIGKGPWRRELIKVLRAVLKG